MPIKEIIWRHITITWNGKEQKLYENGKHVKILSISPKYKQTGPNLDLSHKPFYIGTKDNNKHRTYGIIDEVRVWNKVRSESEIVHNLNRELSALEPGLVGYWSFNSRRGDTAYDGSGNNHHGRLYHGVQRVGSTAPLSPFYWLEVTPGSCKLNPGTSQEIVFKINTADLKGGDYHTNLFITQNGIKNPVDTVLVSIHVIDAPHISVSKDTIKFQDVFLGEIYSQAITITNNGYKKSAVNKIDISNDDFEIDTSSFILEECKNQTINITYKPSLFSRTASKLVIYSDDPVFPGKEIILTRDRIMVPKDKLIRWIQISALILMLVFLGMIYYRYRLKNKLNRNLKIKVEQAVEKQQKQQKIIIHQSGIASLGELAAGISEEINQPLQNILHAAEVQDMELNEESPDVTQLEKLLQEQYANIGKTREIVDHIRIFSSQQKMNITEEFSVNDCIDNTILILKQQYKNNQIFLKFELDEGLPIISGNPHKLEQALINILNNSRDAVNLKAEKAGPEYHKRIIIKTILLNGGITVQVEDNGVGIPEKNMAFIFEPFFTTKGSDKRIGLGLAIAQEIVNELNGTIDVQSDLQYGTKISINVPVKSRTHNN
ncbi:MAG: hypothetical protein K8R53_02745 [Bacteroidales bacterium]|nr:hypothetical protein [Bacteroidales bacterium]